jgi:hypothetical protein
MREGIRQKIGKHAALEKASQSLRPQAQRKYRSARKRAKGAPRPSCAAASRSLFKREPSETGLV